MRILLISHEFTMSGAARNLLKIADHLMRSGHECAVFPTRPGTGPFELEYARRGIPILEKAVLADCAAALCNTIHTGAFVSKTARHTRPIWWIREAESGLEFLIKRPNAIRGFYNAKAVVFQSVHQRDNVFRSFVYGLDPEKLFVIPNGYRVARAGPTVAKSRPIRVATVGLISTLKRQADLIRAIHALDRPDIECVLIGRHLELGEEETRIARAAPDRFKLLGELPHEETLAWLRSSDIYCQPSRSESQGNALFEAALTGSALVAADLLTHREFWRHRMSAIMHPVGDVQALAHAIGELASDAGLRARLAQAAGEVAARYTEERFYAEFDRLLDVVCR